MGRGKERFNRGEVQGASRKKPGPESLVLPSLSLSKGGPAGALPRGHFSEAPESDDDGAAAFDDDDDDDESVEDTSSEGVLSRLIDNARQRIVVLRRWSADHSGARHFDGQSPRVQVCLLAQLLTATLDVCAERPASDFWVECALHAVLRSLHGLVGREIADDSGHAWRGAARILFGAAAAGRFDSAPWDDAKCDGRGVPRLASADVAKWRTAVDYTVAAFVSDATTRRALCGAVADEDVVEALRRCRGDAFVADVAAAAASGGETALRPRRCWAPDDCRRGNALVACLNAGGCGESDFFDPVGWSTTDDTEAQRIRQVREALDLLQSAERSASDARETASVLVARAQPQKLARAKRAFEAADALWREQCKTLCETLSLLLRAVAHSQEHGWVHVLGDVGRGATLAHKFRGFERIAPARLSCTDTLYSDLVDLQDYISSCHSLCLPSDVLWELLETR